jgi:hypothetical protein
VANSIGREAVPAGLFTGKSKQLYDCLYGLTRGAVVPSRSVRISRAQLMAKANIGSRVTFDANIERLKSVGLIYVRPIAGEHTGNEYTVLLPEEITADVKSLPSQTTLSSQTSLTGSTQKLDRLVSLETSQTRQSQTVDLTDTSGKHKNSLKSSDDDDTHTLGKFAEIMLEAARCVVGGSVNKSKEECARWEEVATILAEELRRAAHLTGPISSAPAFLAAHLRRALRKRGGSESEDQTQPDEEKPPPERAPRATKEARARRRTAEEAKSTFSLEDCLKYAKHLAATGQGITNPGGYATTIYRTGEADELIAKFLAQPVAPEDTSRCPDCHGSGWWYPHGIEQGVVKCRHERMSRSPLPAENGSD